jgi:hypothetical protein
MICDWMIRSCRFTTSEPARHEVRTQRRLRSAQKAANSFQRAELRGPILILCGRRPGRGRRRMEHVQKGRER